MSKLYHAASLISSDAASTRKATLQHRTINRKPINTRFDALYLRWKVASLCLDGHGANSSIATAPCYSPSRIREASYGFPSATAPRLCFPCHPSCDNPCGLYRRLGSDREPLEASGRP